MNTADFPALFVTADTASAVQQKRYLALIRSEYGLLLLAALLTLVDSKSPAFLAFYASVFISSLAILAWRAHSRPEQGWYKSRALAESVKTLSWRYSMRAEPFDDVRQEDANKDFRDSLAALLRSNRHIAYHLAGLDAGGAQITAAMSKMRNSALLDRKTHYLLHRVGDQQKWYSSKAASNKKMAMVWQGVSAACYISGVVMVLTNIEFVEIKFPVEPVIVLASAILGWMQIKKFNELASAYTLTAHEIGLAETVISDACTEHDFSRAVNEVELVFSREHTQWIARQTAGE